MNGLKALGLHIFGGRGVGNHNVNVMCGFEVTRETEQLEVEGGMCPSASLLATPMIVVL